MIKQEIINRKQFLNKLGLGVGAIMATYCLGGLTNCNEGSDIIVPDVDFILNLDDQAYDDLKTVGGHVRKNKVVIALVSEGNFVAVSQI